MPDVSFTTFLRFLSAQPVTRLHVVRDAMDRYSEDYSPAKDYWRLLRNRIVEYERSGLPRDHLSGYHEQVGLRKSGNYQTAIEDYLRWRGRKALQWVEPPRWHWESDGLRVRVNPELGFRVDDALQVVKLYFEGTPLRARRLGAALHLLSTGAAHGDIPILPSILDVRRRRLFVATPLTNEAALLLRSDARHFVSIWELLSGQNNLSAA